MADYKSMYYKLAAQVADAIELLTEAQRQAEEAYISSEDDGGLDNASQRS